MKKRRREKKEEERESGEEEEEEEDLSNWRESTARGMFSWSGLHVEW